MKPLGTTYDAHRRELALALNEAETGTRGFVLTGNEQYLQPYDRAIKDIPGIVGDLRSLPDNEVSSNKEQYLTALTDEAAESDKSDGSNYALRRQGIGYGPSVDGSRTGGHGAAVNRNQGNRHC